MMETKKETTSPKVVPKTDIQIVDQENPAVNDYDIDAYLDKRTEFIQKVNKIMVEGKDFHLIQNKKSMAKGGAEKIASIFGWQAQFLPDDDTIKMLGTDKGVVAYVCKLTKGSVFVGEGRGARTLAQDKGDVNKAIKMAAKSAFVDAVLRASGLSDFYTQDIEDMPKIDTPFKSTKLNEVAQEIENDTHKTKMITLKQGLFIKSLRTQKGLPKIEDAEIRKMTAKEASEEIKRLQELGEVITIERDELPL